VSLGAQLGAAGHALLTKRDARAATGWIGLILLVPLLGWIIYFLFGINRIQRRAETLRSGGHVTGELSGPTGAELSHMAGTDHGLRQLERLMELGGAVSQMPYSPGNHLTLLTNGDEAYPAMLEAIARARHSIALSTYIFNHDKAGKTFIQALREAKERGVKVRVLIDGVGSHYSFPSAVYYLHEAGIPCERFLHSFLPWQMPYLNMRNHQKILVIDGAEGFTGSMNIAEGNLTAQEPAHPILDRHFKVEGPVVGQLMRTFAHEWRFVTGEILTGPLWFPPLERKGDLIVRGLPSGPDLPRNPLRWMLLGAIAQAQESIRIVTPYFLPDSTLRAALSVAAMRGVKVDIVLPANNNLFYMKWAMLPQFEELLETGCRIYETEGPFDHTKLTAIDGLWSFLGSANWDARSLRLNFEFNLEAFGRSLAEDIDREIGARIARARPLTISALQERSVALKVRDNIARLFSPYL
jgi:cardiolipin synthase